jgi:hypothetical protein
VVTAAIETLKVEPTSAVTAKVLAVRVANATMVESIVALLAFFVVIFTKKEELIDDGFVNVVYGTTIVVPILTDTGDVTVRVRVPLVEKFVVLVPSPVSDSCTPVVVTIPDGVVHVPEAVVQYSNTIV